MEMVSTSQMGQSQKKTRIRIWTSDIRINMAMGLGVDNVCGVDVLSHIYLPSFLW